MLDTFASYVNWSEVKVSQSCLTLWDLMGYTGHGILQARIQEWIAFPFCRGFSHPRDWTQVSCIAGGFFTSWAMREAPSQLYSYLFFPNSLWTWFFCLKSHFLSTAWRIDSNILLFSWLSSLPKPTSPAPSFAKALHLTLPFRMHLDFHIP